MTGRRRILARALPALALAGCAGSAREEPTPSSVSIQPAEPEPDAAGARASGRGTELAPSSEFDPAPPEVQAILREALESGSSWELLTGLCAAAPHRLAGSEGAERSVEWARAAMLAAGLENVRLEPCTVPRWERGPTEELVVVEPERHAGERLPILALGGSVATDPGGLEAEVIAVRSSAELAERAAEAQGRIVLFDRPMPDGPWDPFEAYGDAVPQRSNGAIEAARAGAVAALVRSMTQRLDDEPHTGAMRYAEDVARVPAAAVSTNAAERIGAWLRAGERVRLRLSLECRTHAPVESANVVGELVGRELPGEIVVVGGHLDAWDVGQGAHDDGAGCVQALEALRILRALGLRPRRTLRCVLFMNEENGLAGARAYRAAHDAELGAHVLAIESDRGAFTPRGFTTDATGPAFDALRELVRMQEATGARLLIAGGGGADIGPLAEGGVVLAGYYPDPQRYFDFHHSRHDVLGAVHPRELALGAAAVASLAWLAAEREETLPRNEPRSRD